MPLVIYCGSNTGVWLLLPETQAPSLSSCRQLSHTISISKPVNSIYLQGNNATLKEVSVSKDCLMLGNGKFESLNFSDGISALQFQSPKRMVQMLFSFWDRNISIRMWQHNSMYSASQGIFDKFVQNLLFGSVNIQIT